MFIRNRAKMNLIFSSFFKLSLFFWKNIPHRTCWSPNSVSTKTNQSPPYTRPMKIQGGCPSWCLFQGFSSLPTLLTAPFHDVKELTLNRPPWAGVEVPQENHTTAEPGKSHFEEGSNAWLRCFDFIF